MPQPRQTSHLLFTSPPDVRTPLLDSLFPSVLILCWCLLVTPRGLGKCMRVAPSEEVATDGFDDPTPLEAPSRPQVEDAPCDISLMNNASKQPSKKELQGKYMSESLRNFRPALPSKSALESKPAMVLSDTLSSSSNDLEDCTEKMAEEDIQRMASVSSNPQLMMTLAPKSSSTTTESLKSAAVLKPIAIEPTKKEITPKTSKKRVSFGGNDMAPEALAPVEIKRPKTEQQVQIWSDNSNNPEPSSQVVTTNIFNEPDRRLSINGKSFMSLSLLGKGGSSVVQRVISCQDGAIYALKRIQISSNDQEDADAVFHSYTNEIDLLKRLQGSSPYIIELVDHVINTAERSIAMLLEPGDIDLAKLLNQRLKAATAAGSTAAYLDPIFARMVWKEMLLAVHHIHTHRIIHGDLKPANFVFVKGHLKLIDFGIAKRISNDTTNIYRDSQIGTVNYMAPEAISPDSVIPMDPSKVKTGKKSRSHQYSMKLGRASDIWSLGCILYQMIYSRPPFSALSTIQKLTAIPNPKYAISYPAQADVEAVASIQLCLQRDPRARASIVGDNGLLQQPYLTVVGASASALSASASSTFTAAEQQQQTIERVVELLKQQAMSTFVPKSSSNNAAMATVSQRIQTWFDGLNTQQLADQVRSDPSVAANDEEDEDDADSCMTTETMQSPQSASAAASLGTSSSAADSAVHSDSDTEAEEDGDKADADEDDDCDTMQSTVKMEVEDGLGMGPAPVVAAAVSCGAPLGSGKVIFGKAGAKNKIILPVDEKENRCVTAANVPAPAVDQSISVVKKRPLQAQSQQPIVSHANELVDALAKRRKVVSVDSEENRVVSRSTVSVPQSVSTLASSSSAKKAARPAKASSVMTTTLKDQILAQASNLRDTKSEAAQRVTAKWQRPAEEGVEDDLKSLLARKMEDMRYVWLNDSSALS